MTSASVDSVSVHAFRRHLSLLTGFALAAILALALLPTVSRALAHAQGGSAWAEVCTPQGTRLVALEDGQAAPVGPAAAMHLEHCPLCALSSVAQVPPSVAPAVLLPLHSAAPPALFLHAPYTLAAWRSAQPRGPPAFS